MTSKTWIDNGCLQLVVVFAGQNAGIREVADKIWLVSFIDYDLGFFDEDENKVQPANNPFMPKVLPILSVYTLKIMVHPRA